MLDDIEHLIRRRPSAIGAAMRWVVTNMVKPDGIDSLPFVKMAPLHVRQDLINMLSSIGSILFEIMRFLFLPWAQNPQL